MAACITVGAVKCYMGTSGSGSAFPIGTLQYFPCPLIDGVFPDASNLGDVIRYDGPFPASQMPSWTVTQLNPSSTYTTTGMSLTTNASCNPVSIDGCTDPLALNYNANATTDDGSCTYPILECMQVGAVKCYMGTGGAGSAFPVGTLQYFPCPLIDGVHPDSGNLGDIIRYDGPFPATQGAAWRVTQVDPSLPIHASVGMSLTTNASCNPVITTSTNHPSNGSSYTWDQVKVLQPDGTYKAYIFSPLYYKPRVSTAGHSTSYPSQLAEGNFRVTRGDMGSFSDNSWFHRVVYLFADEDGKYPIEQKIFPPNYGGTVPDPRMNIGPTEGGPDDPTTANTNIDPNGELFNMWSPGMPMEGVFPVVGDIIKMTDLQIDYRDSVWYNTSTPWNHVLPVQSPCPGEYHWIIPHTGCGTQISHNPYQTWAGGTASHINWPAGAITPNQDQLCLQVLAVINETQFNSTDTFLPSQTQPIQTGPAFLGYPTLNNEHTCYKLGVEGCHYHDRANNTRKGIGDRYNHNTPTVQEGIGHMTLYMKPDTSWVGEVLGQETNGKDFQCYDVCAFRIADDNTFPNISNGSNVFEQWNPRLVDEGPTGMPTNQGPMYPTDWMDDCCNIHCPVDSGKQLHMQPSHTKGYRVPYDGRYRIRYDAEVYQAHGNAWTDPSWWTAWVTIDRKIVTWSNSVTGMVGGIGTKFSNPNTWSGNGQNGGVGWGSHPTQQSYYGQTGWLPVHPPWNALLNAHSYGMGGGYCAHWDAEDSNGNYRRGGLNFDINLKKGMEIQIVFKGRNKANYHTNYSRIRKQYFRVHPFPVPGISYLGSGVQSVPGSQIMVWNGPFYFNQVIQNYPVGGTWELRYNHIPPPDALCYDCAEGIDVCKTWDCESVGWDGKTTICESAEKCLRIPSWNCDLSLSHLPVTIDPDGTGEWWRIEGGGCIDPGDGSGTFKSFSGNTYSTPSCIENCNQPWWDCDGNGSCVMYTTVSTINAYLSLAACQANCFLESWDCDMTQGLCYDPGTGNGQYTSLAVCNQYCHATTYNCGGAVGGTPGVCYQSNGPGGQYMTLAACQSNCFPDTYNCVLGSCVNPGDGTGIHSSLIICKDVCSDNEPCSVYISTLSSGVYTEPGGTVLNNGIHNLCTHDLWYYDVTAGTTTWAMKLPRQVGSGFDTTCHHQNGVASTKTKFWTYNDQMQIVEYDIDQTDPTILTYNRTIDLTLVFPTLSHLKISFMTAINNKTLILARQQGTTDTMVVNLNIHPVVGPAATDKFIIPSNHISSDVVFLPSETAIFVSDTGAGTIRKYDYISGVLLSS